MHVDNHAIYKLCRRRSRRFRESDRSVGSDGPSRIREPISVDSIRAMKTRFPVVSIVRIFTDALDNLLVTVHVLIFFSLFTHATNVRGLRSPLSFRVLEYSEQSFRNKSNTRAPANLLGHDVSLVSE